MARKRDEAIKANLAGWLDDAAAAEAAELAPSALSFHRRAGAPDVLVVMAQDGRAWEVPDRAGGWTARRELRSVAARGLTRLTDADERRALARLGVVVSDLAPPGPLPAAEVEAPAARRAQTPAPAVKAKPAAPAQGAFPGGRRMVTAYLDASEAAELDARAAADDRSVSYVVRAAVRAYLGLS